MARTAWEQLADDLIALDSEGHFAAAHKHPRVKKWHTWIDEVDDLGQLEWIARALTSKRLVAAVDPLIAAMKRDGIEERLPTVYAIGNALYTIEPKDRLNDFLELASLRRLDYGRNRVIEHLSRYKKSTEAFECLIGLLNDESVRGAALEALKRFGDPRAIPAIEQTPVREGDDDLYERHQKEMALKKLRAKQSR